MTRDSHLSHDPYLVAQLAADDVTGSDRIEAERLVADCDRCAELFTDLRAIAAATAELPTPVRTRDFRLTPADAARLRSPWQRLLGSLAQPRFGFTAPLGAALATLGLAGLLVGVLPNLSVSTGSSGAAPARISEQATAAPIAAPVGKSAPETAGPAAAGAAPSAAPSAAPTAAPSILALPAPTAAPAAAAASAAPTRGAAAGPTAPPTAAPTTAEAQTTAASAAPTPPPVPAPSGSGLAPVLAAPAGSAAASSEAAPPAAGATSASGSGFSGLAAPASDTATGPTTAPPNADGASPEGSNPAGRDTTASSPTPGLGVTTGIAPHRDAVGDSGATTSGSPVSPLIIGSIALLLAGLVLLVARRAAVRASR